uniref:Serrate RNA effector molecule n=1 Tax=Aceria tosichella TaxID=561515 RepID=A0A6G1S7N4_9ACAR
MALHQNYNNNYSAYPSNKGKQLMSFQSYVRSLSNNVDENAACKKYKDFMADLSQSKVGRFFDSNKDREWFRLRYHPNESQKMLHQNNINFLKRLKIFNDLNDKNYFDMLAYNAAHTKAIIDLMDAIIIQLEDGSQELSITPDGIVIEPELRLKYVPNKPNSVVIDDINIETTLAEIQDICAQASPELIRIAQLEPYYIEGGILRRKVIAVYSSNVDIRDVCWKLNRLKLNNRSLSVSINKCLTNRVLKVDGIANHHLCILNDIKNAIILILNFDELKGLYGKRKQLLENLKQEPNNINTDVKMEPVEENGNEELNNVAPPSPPGSEKSANDDDDEKPFDVSTLDEEKEKEKKKLFEFKFNIEPSFYRQVSKLSKSKNPILEGAYRFLTEYIESSAARYQLSKVPADLLSDETKEELKDCSQDKLKTLQLILNNLPCNVEESTRYLDKLLWYLRIVHSFDYYNFSHYRYEDDLTLRMGVIHVRDELRKMNQDPDMSLIEKYLKKVEHEFEQFGHSQSQKYVTKDEERYNYKSYGKVITDELTSYSHKIQKPKSGESEEVYKCRHCPKVFQKLSDIGRHFVSKHRWAIDTIELETDFFNAYLFDATKMNPCPPKELLEIPPNRFAKVTNFSHMGEDPDLLQQAIEAYSKMDSFVREPAPRAQVESDPRNDTIVDYTDISFDDAI